VENNIEVSGFGRNQTINPNMRTPNKLMESGHSSRRRRIMVGRPANINDDTFKSVNGENYLSERGNSKLPSKKLETRFNRIVPSRPQSLVE